MASQFKSSFIPKKTISNANQTAAPVPDASTPTVGPTGSSGNVTITPSGSGKKRRKRAGEAVNALLIGAVFVCLVSVLVAGGLFGYRYMIGQDIEKKKEKLAGFEGVIESNKQLINDLKAFDTRLTKGEKVLHGHSVLNPFLTFLESHTLQSVKYTDLQYTHGANFSRITLKGVTDDYESLNYQAGVLRGSGKITTVSFSGLRLNKDGQVEFQLTATVAPSIFSYY